MFKDSIFFIILSLSLPAVSLSSDIKIEIKEHEINHPIDGCPENSICHQTLAQKNKAWKGLLKIKSLKKSNAFVKKNGVPFLFWAERESDQKLAPAPHFSYWDSPCQRHNDESLKSNKFFIAQSFIQKTSKITSLSNKEIKYHPEYIYLKKSNNIIQKYIIPAQSTPVYFSNNKVITIIKKDIFYYALAIATNGQIKVVRESYPEILPQVTKCPTSLEKAFLNASPDGLYSDKVCMSLWDTKSKKKLIFIQGVSCH